MESFQTGDSPVVLMANSTPTPSTSTSTSTSRWRPNSGDWNEASNLAAAALAAPARVWSSLVDRLPPLTCSRLLAARLPPLTDSRLLAAVSDIHRRLLTGHGRRPGLPLPIHQDVSHSIRIAGERPKAYAILEDIVQHTLSSLHSIQKSLLYWQYRAEGTDSQKMYFMIFERGPRAFVEATCETVTRLRNNRSPSQYLLKSASDMISTKLAVLTGMQHCLAAFLAEVYSEADKFRDGLTESSDKSLHTLFIILNTVFPKLEVSLRNAGEGQTVLLFERLQEIDIGSSQWTEVLSVDAISSIYQNLQKLDSFVSSQLSSHEKPRHMTIYWLPYTCGAIGLSACSLWLLRHSSLMGSSDMDNWIQDAKESGAGFWNHRVEKPIISIRDELLKTFRRTGKHVTQKQDVQLTEESLHRMLLAFCEQTSDEKLPQDASDQVLMEIVTKRYVKESAHPIQNFFTGNLARAMLIQIENHRLDLQELMLGMDQIMKANEINFAILAALPAFGLSLLLLLVVQTWVTHDQRAEGRGRIARRQRRLLLEDVQRRLREFQTCMDNGMEEEARCKFGLTLYTLDRLYRAVELHAKETGEWSRLRENLFDLAKPSMEVAAKLAVISESVRNYDCLLPSPTSS